MDDLAILVIVLLIFAGIFYLIGHQYWWIILFAGGVVFVIIVYLTGEQYNNTFNDVNHGVDELQKLKQSLITQANINKLIKPKILD